MIDASPSFEPARRQAQAVLAARIASTPVFLRLPVRAAAPSRPMVALAVALGLLGVSGAWAFIHHPHAAAPAEAARSPQPVIAPTQHAKAPPPPPVAMAVRPSHRRARPKPTPAPATTQRFDDEPFGDVIFGQAKRMQPPLFDVEEYKKRGIFHP